MQTVHSPLTLQYETDIHQLQQDLDQINKSLFDATAHTAILLVNHKGELLQANNYFHQILREKFRFYRSLIPIALVLPTHGLSF